MQSSAEGSGALDGPPVPGGWGCGRETSDRTFVQADSCPLRCRVHLDTPPATLGPQCPQDPSRVNLTGLVPTMAETEGPRVRVTAWGGIQTSH